MPNITEFREGALVQVNVQSLRLYDANFQYIWLEKGDFLLTVKIEYKYSHDTDTSTTKVYFLHLRSGKVGLYYFNSNTKHSTVFFDALPPS